MINGNEYAWEDIQLVVEGSATPLVGFTNIEYTVEKEHKNIYGKGARPIAMGRGNEQFSGSLSLLQSELEALQASLPGGYNLTQKTPFAITVSYAPAGGALKTDQLLYVRFGKITKGMKQGDPNMEVQIPLIIGDISFNI